MATQHQSQRRAVIEMCHIRAAERERFPKVQSEPLGEGARLRVHWPQRAIYRAFSFSMGRFSMGLDDPPMDFLYNPILNRPILNEKARYRRATR